MLDSVSTPQNYDNSAYASYASGGSNSTEQLEEALLTQLLSQNQGGAQGPLGGDGDSPEGAGGVNGGGSSQLVRALIQDLLGQLEGGAGGAPGGAGGVPGGAGGVPGGASAANGANEGEVAQLMQLLSQLQGTAGGAQGGQSSASEPRMADPSGGASGGLRTPASLSMAGAPAGTPSLTGNVSHDMQTLNAMVSANNTDGTALATFAHGVESEAANRGDGGSAVAAGDIGTSLTNGSYSKQTAEQTLHALGLAALSPSQASAELATAST